MFSAIIFVCAINANQVTETCAVFKDSWGPYKTQVNCQIRVDQMEKELSKNKPYLFYQLGNPDALSIKKICENTLDDTV